MIALLSEIVETEVGGGLKVRASRMMEVRAPLMISETEVVDSEGVKVRAPLKMMIVARET